MQVYIKIMLLVVVSISMQAGSASGSHSCVGSKMLAPVSSLFEFYNHIEYVLNHEETVGAKNIYKYIHRKYIQDKNMAYFSVDGLSSVGKTTFTYGMAKYLRERGYKPVVIHLDNYNPFGKTMAEKIPNRIRRILYSIIESKGEKVFTEFDFDDMSDVVNRLVEIKASGKKTVLHEPNLTVFDELGKSGRANQAVIDKNTVVLFEGTFVAHQLAKTNLIDKYIMLSADMERQMKSHKQRTLSIIKRMLNPFNRGKWSESLSIQIMRYYWYPFLYSNFFAPHYYNVYRPAVDKYTDIHVDNTNFALPLMVVNEVEPEAFEVSSVSDNADAKLSTLVAQAA